MLPTAIPLFAVQKGAQPDVFSLETFNCKLSKDTCAKLQHCFQQDIVVCSHYTQWTWNAKCTGWSTSIISLDSSNHNASVSSPKSAPCSFPTVVTFHHFCICDWPRIPFIICQDCALTYKINLCHSAPFSGVLLLLHALEI